MAFKIVVSRNAEIEIEKTLGYYGKFSGKSSQNFQKQLNLSYKKLKENPFFQLRYLNVRALPIKNYPYILLYRVNEDTKTVFVLSVSAHIKILKNIPKIK